MTLVSAVLLGVLQGLTEFLPVSSTAHLLLAGRALAFEDPGDVFKISIQFGSILAVMWLYRARLLGVLRGLRSRPEARHFVLMILVAFAPAVVAGLLLEGFVKQVLYERPSVIATAFIAGGIVMLVVERFRPQPVVASADRTPLSRAFAIGVCQTLALVPGVSRSGATIIGGLVAGLDRAAAAEFSFFLAMPTMAGAFVHEIWSVRHELTPDRGAELAVGFAMAFLAALLVVKPFLRIVGRSGFVPFAWYRIVAGLAVFGAIGAGWL
ncbi:MAG: undecaprenyl-diphosphate phosphatase [Acidobacteria bacterium]|nr:undecaprenyl-diphosphate phosphatase [Acidobacteriota bacterium]